MGETDEFVPQSSDVEDETVQEPAAEDSAELTFEEPAADEDAQAEFSSAPEVAPDVEPDTATAEDAAPEPAPDATIEPAQDAAEVSTEEPDELDEISKSLSSEGGTDAEGTDADSGTDAQAVGEDVAADTGSFDDIAPPTPAAVPVSPVPEPSDAAGQVPWWPFIVYLGAWVALAAAAVWQLLQLPAGQAVYESPAYVMTILGGLIMTAMGPLLILAVWLGTRASRSPQERAGLLTSALMKGALVTLSGAIIWWASLVIIDYLRLGRLL